MASSRANSVQPSDTDNAKKGKLDRVKRTARERTQSPDPRTLKKKVATKPELPTAILDFLAALPPARIFDGATFHVEELVKLIRNVNVPLPASSIGNSKRGHANDDDGDARAAKKNRGN